VARASPKQDKALVLEEFGTLFTKRALQDDARTSGAAFQRVVRVSVTNEGPFEKSADLDRIFEKLYLSDRVEARQAATGLGLSSCGDLIEAIGGHIHAENPVARQNDTRMVIQLPAVAAPALAQERA
jgi:K+-sensing histidine kinase KdpD